MKRLLLSGLKSDRRLKEYSPSQSSDSNFNISLRSGPEGKKRSTQYLVPNAVFMQVQNANATNCWLHPTVTGKLCKNNKKMGQAAPTAVKIKLSTHYNLISPKVRNHLR